MKKKSYRAIEEAEIVRNPLKESLYPYKVYSLYLHLVYRPISRANFLTKVRSLDEFLRIAKRRGLEQKRKDHPLALEFLFSFSSAKPLSEEEIKEIGKKMAEALISHEVVGIPFPAKILNYMDFGIEINYSFKPVPEFVRLLVSRDGIRFSHLVPPRYLLRYLLG